MPSMPEPLWRLGRLPVVVFGAALLLLFLLLRIALPGLNATSAEATTISLVVVTVLAVSVAVVRRAVVSAQYRGRSVRLLLMVLWPANLAFFGAAVLRIWLDLPYPVAAGAGAVLLVGGLLAYRRTADVGPMQLFTSAVQPLSSAQARTLAVDARRAMARAGNHAGRRLTAQLNLARALISLSMADEARAELAVARELVEEVLGDPGADRRILLEAAVELVSAVGSYAHRTRDLRDYPVALEILSDLAGGVPEAQSKVLECRADYELLLGELALEEARATGDAWPMVPHYTDAVHYLTRAADLATNDDTRMVLKARAASTDAQLTAINSLGREERLKDDEQECRVAFAHFRRPGAGRVMTGLALAGSLAATAGFQLERGQSAEACQRLVKAEQLCERLLSRSADFEPLILRLLTDVRRMKEQHCG